MTRYTCPVAWRRRPDDVAGRLTLDAVDGSRSIVFGGVVTCQLPEPRAGLTVEELRPAGPGGRAILVLRAAGGDGSVEAADWWVHEPRPGFFSALHAGFAPTLATRLTALTLVTLMGVPGLRGLFRAWHALRTR